MPHLPSISLETGWCADAPRPTADFKRRRRHRLSSVVYLANCLAHLAGSAPGCEAYALKMQSRVTTAVELTPETLEGLVIQVRKSCERAESLMVK